MTHHDAESPLAALPEAVRARVLGAGLDDATTADLLVWPAGTGLVFVGSLADGTGRRDSDLDFVVFHDADTDFDAWMAARAFTPIEITRSTLVNRVLAVRGGVEFDIWFVARPAWAPLRAVLDASLGPDGSLVGLPGLQYLEAKLLTRLHHATVLAGADTVDRWREELRIAALPAMRIAGGLVGALSFLEDAWSIGALAPDDPADGDPLGGVIAARTAAEHLAQAALADEGVLAWDLRYARAHRDRLAARGPLVAALRDLEDLLLPGRDTTPAVYAARVLTDLLELTDRLGAEPPASAGRVAVDYIIEFARDRFALPIDVTAEGLHRSTG